MITDKLRAAQQEIILTTEQVSEFRNKETQHKIDLNYTEEVKTAYSLVSLIIDLKTNTGFTVKPSTLSQIKETITFLSNFNETRHVDVQTLKNGKDLMMSINKSLETEWKIYFTNSMSSTLKTLVLIQDITDKNVANYISDISNGKEWNSSFDSKLNSFRAMKSANDIIANLNINDEVNNFLLKVSKNRATLADLTDNVMKWVQENHLKSKIRLSF